MGKEAYAALVALNAGTVAQHRIQGNKQKDKQIRTTITRERGTCIEAQLYILANTTAIIRAASSQR